jgi:hypothetical protein
LKNREKPMMLIKMGIGIFVAAVSLQASAATLNVCPSGCTYALPSSAMNAAVAGDTIQIQPGTYNDCMVINKNNITVVGVNGTPKMVNRVCLQKGIIVTAAQNAVLRNIELSGATNNDNYAGIRHDALGFNLTLDGVYIHDNDDGILSSSSGDTLLIKNSRFQNNGMNAVSGMAHNLYIGHSASVTFLNSTSNSAKLAGHEFKTRALKTVIDGSTIATLGGRDSRNIDISNGGEVLIRNSVLEKGPNSDNSDMIAYGPEGIDTTKVNTFTMTGTVLIGDKVGTTSISYFKSPTSLNVSGNTYVAVAGAPTGNTVYASRSAAGFQAYPWLPASGGVIPTPTPTPVPTPTPSSWVFCANENAVCSFSGTRTVRYGAGTKYVTKTVTSSVNCNNSVFGDPVVGVAKHCDYSSTTLPTPTPTPTPPPSWTFCANENQTCSFSGTRVVRYGAGTSFYTKIVTGTVSCSNGVFGDPLYGTAKHCDYGPAQ